MRNRAKCKLCGTVLESVVPRERLFCSCGEIGISGGKDAYISEVLTSYDNFLRVDDEGNEHPVRHGSDKDRFEEAEVITQELAELKEKTDILRELQRLIESMETLEESAMRHKLDQYDYLTLLRLIRALFRD